MRPVMLWFLPLAAGVAFLGFRMAKEYFLNEGWRKSDGLLLLVLTWYPALMWIVVQFTSQSSRHP